jgi:hypothetical protein
VAGFCSGCLAESRLWFLRAVATALLLFVLFLVFLEVGFFFAKQLLDYSALRRIGSGFEDFPVVRNVLLPDKAFHTSLQGHNFLRWPLS